MNTNPMPDVESSNTGKITDFSINGLAGIRLVDAADHDRAMVRRQLGLHPGSLAGEP